jgi:hypothetical protein
MAAAVEILVLLLANVLVGIVRLVTFTSITVARWVRIAYRHAEVIVTRLYARKGWL